MLQDILKDTPVYQQIVQMGREDGLREGRMEGRAEGLAEGRVVGVYEGELRALMSFIQIRFPRLVPIAEEYTTAIESADRLQSLLMKMFAAQTYEEAAQILFDAGKEK